MTPRTILYHGTKTARAMQILHEGLLANPPIREWPWNSKPGCTYGAKSQREATMWARGGLWGYPESDPESETILLLVVPTARVRPDRNFDGDPETPNCEIDGDVSPAAILCAWPACCEPRD